MFEVTHLGHLGFPVKGTRQSCDISVSLSFISKTDKDILGKAINLQQISKTIKKSSV